MESSGSITLSTPYQIVCPSSSRPRSAFGSWIQLPSHNWLIQGQTSNAGNVEQGLRGNSVWVAWGRTCWARVPYFRVAWDTDTTICKWEKTLEWRYRGLVSIERGGGLPGLPTLQTNPEAQSCFPVLGSSRWYASHFLLTVYFLCTNQV